MFPEGVASGDPDHSSVLLWTRRPYAAGVAARTLDVEVAEDRAFGRVVVSATGASFGGVGLDVPRVGGWTEAGAGVLVSLYRQRGEWKSRGSDTDRSCGGR